MIQDADTSGVAEKYWEKYQGRVFQFHIGHMGCVLIRDQTPAAEGRRWATHLRWLRLEDFQCAGGKTPAVVELLQRYEKGDSDIRLVTNLIPPLREVLGGN